MSKKLSFMTAALFIIINILSFNIYAAKKPLHILITEKDFNLTQDDVNQIFVKKLKNSNEYKLDIKLNSKMANKIKSYIDNSKNKLLYIVLDKEVIAGTILKTGFGNHLSISGLTLDKAERYANLLADNSSNDLLDDYDSDNSDYS